MQQQTKQYQRSQTFDVPADRLFAFVSEVGNLPKYMPPVTSAQAIPPDKVRIHVEIPQHGSADGEGYYRVYRDERRMEWGANVGRDYSGRLTVTDQGATRSELTVELSFGPRSAEPQIEQESRPDRDPLEEGIGATLESIRRHVEGEGGKVPTPSPQG